MLNTTSPFAALNLWRNPFGELTREERASLAIVDLAPIEGHLRDGRSAVQLIGPCGHGKTTHLLALQARLGSVPYVYLPEDGPQPRIPPQRPLLLDEAQRLGPWKRWKLFRTSGPLVLGTHVDLSPWLSRQGWRVLTLDISAGPSTERLADILNARIEAARRQPGPVPRIETAEALTLQSQFGADLRAIEHHLYDCFQRRARESPTWQPVT